MPRLSVSILTPHRITYGSSAVEPSGQSGAPSHSSAAIIVLSRLGEERCQTYPSRCDSIMVVGPMGNLSILDSHDRCTCQRNWRSKLERAVGHSLGCGNLPFSNDVISALEG